LRVPRFYLRQSLPFLRLPFVPGVKEWDWDLTAPVLKFSTGGD